MTPGRDIRPDISVVIPCLNEEDNVVAIAAAAQEQIERLSLTYEIIFIDNASTDRTAALIQDLCLKDSRIKYIQNTRNFGQMRSPTHAIFSASGKAIIGLCADFQDPPELIPVLIEHWRAGAPIVLGVRQSERTSLWLRLIRAIGYTVYSRLGDYHVIPNATGFGLYDQRVIAELRTWRDPEPFFRGMLVESGFKIVTIPYHRPERRGGRTKNTFWELLRFGVSGFAAASRGLLRAPLYFAVASGVILAGLGVMTLISCFIAPQTAWRWLVADVALLLFTMNCAFLGLIGEQVRLIALTVRQTPLVIEKERINFADQSETPPSSPTL